MTSHLRIGVLGAGTVGAQVIRILKEDPALPERLGATPQITGVLVRDVNSPRAIDIPRELLTVDPQIFFPENPEERPELLVELMGGIEPARTFILQAFAQGTAVVTANKALIAAHGSELFAAAQAAGVGFYYEAAVAGAVPVIRALRESLAGDHVTKIQGIVNGTTNFILDSMTSNGMEYADALSQAQELGYAEADPTADVEGHDAAAKCAIMASIAFNADVRLSDVSCTGISQITAEDIAQARDNEETIKLIATAEYHGAPNETIHVSVAPQRLPNTHPLAQVGGAFNAVYVTAENAGELMFYGPGAGGAPTASAVCGDIIQAVRTRIGHTAPAQPQARRLPIC